eukprot:Gregarina_sp_Poly_1__1193@NODE_1292_length_4473_cov_272_597821_g873_i0_p1_GENE_NODE_1292_length_4473_cov_272_597821_g873_i0NODE_1292_length_4473_cov_272_597821_g873_i0_p1_ORF_typecomplete_len1242_score130_46_NODE_1292_length_4473_cov_272_597821_g873_i05984323
MKAFPYSNIFGNYIGFWCWLVARLASQGSFAFDISLVSFEALDSNDRSQCPACADVSSLTEVQSCLSTAPLTCLYGFEVSVSGDVSDRVRTCANVLAFRMPDFSWELQGWILPQGSGSISLTLDGTGSGNTCGFRARNFYTPMCKGDSGESNPRPGTLQHGSVSENGQLIITPPKEEAAAYIILSIESNPTHPRDSALKTKLSKSHTNPKAAASCGSQISSVSFNAVGYHGVSYGLKESVSGRTEKWVFRTLTGDPENGSGCGAISECAALENKTFTLDQVLECRKNAPTTCRYFADAALTGEYRDICKSQLSFPFPVLEPPFDSAEFSQVPAGGLRVQLDKSDTACLVQALLTRCDCENLCSPLPNGLWQWFSLVDLRESQKVAFLTFDRQFCPQNYVEGLAVKLSNVSSCSPLDLISYSYHFQSIIQFSGETKRGIMYGDFKVAHGFDHSSCQGCMARKDLKIPGPDYVANCLNSMPPYCVFSLEMSVIGEAVDQSICQGTLGFSLADVILDGWAWTAAGSTGSIQFLLSTTGECILWTYASYSDECLSTPAEGLMIGKGMMTAVNNSINLPATWITNSRPYYNFAPLNQSPYCPSKFNVIIFDDLRLFLRLMGANVDFQPTELSLPPVWTFSIAGPKEEDSKCPMVPQCSHDMLTTDALKKCQQNLPSGCFMRAQGFLQGAWTPECSSWHFVLDQLTLPIEKVTEVVLVPAGALKLTLIQPVTQSRCLFKIVRGCSSSCDSAGSSGACDASSEERYPLDVIVPVNVGQQQFVVPLDDYFYPKEISNQGGVIVVPEHAYECGTGLRSVSVGHETEFVFEGLAGPVVEYKDLVGLSSYRSDCSGCPGMPGVALKDHIKSCLALAPGGCLYELTVAQIGPGHSGEYCSNTLGIVLADENRWLGGWAIENIGGVSVNFQGDFPLPKECIVSVFASNSEKCVSKPSDGSLTYYNIKVSTEGNATLDLQYVGDNRFVNFAPVDPECQKRIKSIASIEYNSVSTTTRLLGTNEEYNFYRWDFSKMTEANGKEECRDISECQQEGAFITAEQLTQCRAAAPQVCAYLVEASLIGDANSVCGTEDGFLLTPLTWPVTFSHEQMIKTGSAIKIMVKKFAEFSDVDEVCVVEVVLNSRHPCRARGEDDIVLSINNELGVQDTEFIIPLNEDFRNKFVASASLRIRPGSGAPEWCRLKITRYTFAVDVTFLFYGEYESTTPADVSTASTHLSSLSLFLVSFLVLSAEFVY